MSSGFSKRDRVREFLKRPSRLVGRIAGSDAPSTADSSPPDTRPGRIIPTDPHIPNLTGDEPSEVSKPHRSDARNPPAAPILTDPKAQPKVNSRKQNILSLKNSFEALGMASDLIPPLKSFIDILASSIDVVLNSNKSDQEYKELASIDHQNLKVKQQSYYINSKLQRTGAKRYIEADQDADEILQAYRHLETLIQRLNSNAILDTWRTTYEIRAANDKQHSHALLEKMNPVKEARYDSGAVEIQRGGCTPNTRVRILEELVEWSRNAHGPPVYWMNGMAGTGKTTIAYSFCQKLKEMNQLGASFFCSRLLPGCRAANQIVPTLTYQLGSVYLPFRDELISTIDDDHDIATTSIESQFKNMLSKTMRNIDQAMHARRFVVVLDAIDECSDRASARILVNSLLRFAPELPVKFFITCRPEPGLFDIATSEGQVARSIFHLHDIEESLVKADIETYLKTELSSLDISEDQFERLVECSGTLFIFASTSVRYILPEAVSVNSQKRLNVIIGTVSATSKKLYEPIDALYATIISSVLDNPALEFEEQENIKMILDTVICAQEPLSVEALAQLLGLEGEKDAWIAIESFLSVLHVSNDTNLVSTLHASFHDYITAVERSRQYWCNTKTHNAFLASRCLITMEIRLRFNICHLQSSFLLDQDIPWLPSEIKKQVPLYLSYSCEHWSFHLIQSHISFELQQKLNGFLSHSLLFWLEVMNLKGSVGRVPQMLLETYSWMRNASLQSSAAEVCRDAQIFATVFSANPVRKSTPHIYISLLALWDNNRPLWKQYGARTSGLICAEGSAIQSRQAAELALWKLPSFAESIAISLNGMRVATGCRDGYLRLWDTQTGALLIEFSHSPDEYFHVITSLSFSSNGSQLIAVENGVSTRIFVWDTQTGRLLNNPQTMPYFPNGSFALSSDVCSVALCRGDGTISLCNTQSEPTSYRTLAEYQKTIECLAYSLDGKMIASGFDDYSIHVLDARTGAPMAGPLQGHKTSISFIVFSPDGELIASSSRDHVVCVWQIQTKLAANDMLELIIPEHSQLAFSPDNSRLASASEADFSISIWDTSTGASLGLLIGHTLPISSLVYSPDGSRIYSASEDETIRIWDAYTKNTTMPPTSLYIPTGLALCFSHDGDRIASSCEDGSIYVWSSNSGEILAGPFRGHLKGVITSLSFSPDGSRILSYSSDNVYYIWDIKNCSATLGPFRVPSDARATFVEFSLDLTLIATVSINPNTIQVWDTHTGGLITKISPSHTEPMSVTSYSPDGRRIASGSHDGKIFSWDAYTGHLITGPIGRHNGRVESLKHSPNGRHIVSGSTDGSIRVWDIVSGVPLAGPFLGHRNSIMTVMYSSDGRYIVSSSKDSTIRIWDVAAGDAATNPIEGEAPDGGGLSSTVASINGNLWASVISEDGAIRVWRFPTESSALYTDLQCAWVMDEDGWLVASDGLLLTWIPPDLRSGLIRPDNLTVIHHRGNWRVNLTSACIGARWQDCYTSQVLPRPGVNIFLERD
ncbi:Vegetative incompatibility protein HET-E-1 [Ceratobasidium sp. AG-Ba]|nr:Vegetative incompatibility protein HET-E-1 [Ceratobasidium sp. AG-Ba]